MEFKKGPVMEVVEGGGGISYGVTVVPCNIPPNYLIPGKNFIPKIKDPKEVELSKLKLLRKKAALRAGRGCPEKMSCDFEGTKEEMALHILTHFEVDESKLGEIQPSEIQARLATVEQEKKRLQLLEESLLSSLKVQKDKLLEVSSGDGKCRRKRKSQKSKSIITGAKSGNSGDGGEGEGDKG